jgi:hypothetical protein
VSTEESQDNSNGGRSETENVAGVKLEKARPFGILGLVITIPATLYLALFGLLELNFGMIILAWLPAVGIGLSAMYSMSEKRWMGLSIMSSPSELARNRQKNESDETKSVCRECHEPISPDVKRCPNCGWKPKKRGGLWWGTTAVMSLNPIGWVMGAKGASDNLKASKGVSKEISANETGDTEEEIEVPSESDPTDTLERLNELRNQDAITEAEYESKKEELLDRI